MGSLLCISLGRSQDFLHVVFPEDREAPALAAAPALCLSLVPIVYWGNNFITFALSNILLALTFGWLILIQKKSI